MVTETCQVEKPYLVLRQFSGTAELPVFLEVVTSGSVLVDVGAAPFGVRWEIPQGCLWLIRLRIFCGGFEDGRAGKGAKICVAGGLLTNVPDLFARIDLLEHIQQFCIPVMWVSTVGLGLDVVPPYQFLAPGKCPRALAGHRAGLAAEAAVNIEDKSELPFRVAFLMRIAHLTTNLPVVDVRHRCGFLNRAWEVRFPPLARCVSWFVFPGLA